MTDDHDPNEPLPSDDAGDEGDGGGEPSSQHGDANARPGEGPAVFGEQIRHRQLSARVPESVAAGTFSTGAIVLTGASEFVMDFLVRMARPYQVAARVILPHGAMAQLVKALEENIGKYENRFGDIPPLPPPDPDAKRPSIQEVYDDLKLPDEMLSGTYANACIIGHSPSEFVFDFVTNFFPRSAVASRVYLSSRQVPQMLKGLRHAQQQLDERRRQARRQMLDQNMQGPPQVPPNEGDDEDRPDDEERKDDSGSDLMY